MRKDDDFAGLQLERLSIRQMHDRSAIDDEMVDHQVGRSRGNVGRERFRLGRRETPGRGELSAEEQSAVQLHSAQDIGECIHSILWTAGELFRPDCKTTSIGEPPEQFFGTLGHGCNISRPAQL
jgi:hypothetical protein